MYDEHDFDDFCDDHFDECEECYEEGYDEGFEAGRRNSKKCSSPIKSSSDGCYIATAVYGSYDCPEVWTLRRFRDEVLRASVLGRLFIRSYYAVSPGLVRHIGSKSLFQKTVKRVLDSFVSHLNKAGFRDTPYHGR